MKISIFDSLSLTEYQNRTIYILEEAERLFLQYGYAKVTMDDIASETGLGKGTLYLHWRSKEDLFYGLLSISSAEITHEIIQAIQESPDIILLDQLLIKVYALCSEKKLLMALFTKDSRLLGKLIHKKLSLQSQEIKSDSLRKSIELYRKHGLMRVDSPIDTQLQAIHMLMLSMLNYSQYKNEPLSSHEQTAMFQMIIQNTFLPNKVCKVNEEVFQYVYNEFCILLSFYQNQVFRTTIKGAGPDINRL